MPLSCNFFSPKITEKQENEKQTQECKCTDNNKAFKEHSQGEEIATLKNSILLF